MRQTRAQLIAAGIVKPAAINTYRRETVAEEAARRGVSLSQVRREKAQDALPGLQRDLRAVIALGEISRQIRARSTR